MFGRIGSWLTTTLTKSNEVSETITIKLGASKNTVKLDYNEPNRINI